MVNYLENFDYYMEELNNNKELVLKVIADNPNYFHQLRKDVQKDIDVLNAYNEASCLQTMLKNSIMMG